jgi:hypothetical protein
MIFFWQWHSTSDGMLAATSEIPMNQDDPGHKISAGP